MQHNRLREILPAVCKPNNPPWAETGKAEKRGETGKPRIGREERKLCNVVKKAARTQKYEWL
jgi:hypothetical protein